MSSPFNTSSGKGQLPVHKHHLRILCLVTLFDGTCAQPDFLDRKLLPDIYSKHIFYYILHLPGTVEGSAKQEKNRQAMAISLEV